MKAKLYIGIITAVLLPGFMVHAQVDDSREYSNGYPGTVINNYYDYDYFYASRINRFHRSFATFNYYAPLFTDSYWYNYQPYSMGLSIYGGPEVGLGFSYNSPVYYDYGWNNPWYGSSYYWGYDPFYYNPWFSPVFINLGFRNRWFHNYYSWNNRNHWDSDYRQNYSFNNNHYGRDNQYNNHSSNSNFTNRSESENNNPRVNNVSRREGSNYSQNVNSGLGRNGVNSSSGRRAVSYLNNPSSIYNNQVNSRSTNVGNNERRSENSSTAISTNRISGQVSERSQVTNTERQTQSNSSANVSSTSTVRKSGSVSTPSGRRANVSTEIKSGTGRTENSLSGFNDSRGRIPSYQAPVINRTSDFNVKRNANVSLNRNENSRSGSGLYARSNNNTVQRMIGKAVSGGTRSVSNGGSASFKSSSSSRSSVSKSASGKGKRR